MIKFDLTHVNLFTPNSENQRLHKLEYQFFGFEWMCVFGAIGTVSIFSSGLLGDPELDSPCTRQVKRYKFN
jgi:hypothetical protein